MRPIHFDENYLPSACDELLQADMDKIRRDFCKNLLDYFTFNIMSCNPQDVEIVCGMIN